MKVELVRNTKGDNPTSEIIDLNGTTIMPFNLSVLSIVHTSEGLKINITRDYTTRIDYDLDNEKLWIMGGDDAIDERAML